MAAAHLTAPSADRPSAEEQLGTLRPTLAVKNGTSDQSSGPRTYEFQIADNSSFAASSAPSAGFAAIVGKTGVPEGSGGKTSFTPDTDLQPTTRYWWRARMVQGTVTSEWSPTQTFKTKLVGYNRPGELYDPLIHGETVGTIVGSAALGAATGVRHKDRPSPRPGPRPAPVRTGGV